MRSSVVISDLYAKFLSKWIMSWISAVYLFAQLANSRDGNRTFICRMPRTFRELNLFLAFWKQDGAEEIHRRKFQAV